MFFALDIEKDIVSSLDHKHIVKMEEAYDTNEKTKTLIFELVEGQQLGHHLKHQKEHFSKAQLLFWFMQMTSAMSYLHNDLHMIH